MTFGGLRFEKEDLMKKLLAVCAAAVLLLSLSLIHISKKLLCEIEIIAVCK